MIYLEEVRRLGFNPLQSNFIIATRAISDEGESSRARKIDILKRWGWSEEDIWRAFRKYPPIFMLSEEMMEFFVIQMKRHFFDY